MSDPFEQLAAELERAGDLTRVARAAAPRLAQVVRAEHAAGQAPDGSTWPATLGGKVANLDLTARTTARADGAAIVLELDDLLLPSQAGHHVPLRPVVPAAGAPLPPSWAAPIDEAARAELESG